MDYNQFKSLLQLKGIRNKENVLLVEELLKKFSYFQSARLLLAKSMHDQQNIHYDESLKLAAAYATNRRVLHELVKENLYSETKDILSPKTEPISDPFVEKEKEPYTEWYSEEEISGRAFEEEENQKKIVDPHALIRQRLNEILAPKEEQPKIEHQEEIKVEPTIATKEKEQPIEQKIITISEPVIESKTETTIPVEVQSSAPIIEQPDAEKIIIQEAEKAGDVLDKMEIEHAMEESILSSLEKLPVIKIEEPVPVKTFIKEEKKVEEPVKKDKDKDKAEPKSFTEWLQMLSVGPYSQFEEVHSDLSIQAVSVDSQESSSTVSDQASHEHDSEMSNDDLIDKFIATEPKIVPSKAEFYSPANQARKSVMEHEDVVSETLARIYYNQGNLLKAKWCFEKLSLLHPEKSSYFAALLKEIDHQINNKGDL